MLHLTSDYQLVSLHAVRNSTGITDATVFFPRPKCRVGKRIRPCEMPRDFSGPETLEDGVDSSAESDKDTRKMTAQSISAVAELPELALVEYFELQR